MGTWYRIRDKVVVAAALAAVGVLATWPSVAELTSNPVFYLSLIGSSLITVILVISLNIAMGYTGLLSIIHTGLLAVGGYASGAIAVHLGWSPWIGLLVAVALATVVGSLVAIVSLRATYLYFGMITLAFDLLLVEVAREWESVTGGFFGLVAIPRPAIGAQPLSIRQMYYVIFGFAVLAYLFQRNVVLSRAGRAFQAVRESTDAASALGIRVPTTRVLSFALSSAMAGLAGALFAHWNGFMNPDVGLLDNALVLFIGLMIGGMGTLAGPALGVGFSTVVDQLLKDFATYRRLVLGFILLAAMIVIPRGIVGTWRSSRLGRTVYDESPDAVVTRPPPAEEFVEESEVGTGGVAVEARGVSKRFGGMRALDTVDLEVAAGEVHGIIGPNGSGKTTLINCVTGFYRREEGSVRLFGTAAPGRPHAVAATGVIRVFQIPHLFERVSVVDNVLTGMHMRSRQNWLSAALRLPGFHRDERRMREEARALLGVVRLDGRADWPASALSHGQKRLLEVARALAARPRVLILDEPVTGLTPEEIARLAEVLRALRRTGLTVVLIEHNLAFVMDICDRLTVLDQGRVIAAGTPAEVRRSTAVQEAYLGPSEMVEEEVL